MAGAWANVASRAMPVTSTASLLRCIAGSFRLAPGRGAREFVRPRSGGWAPAAESWRAWRALALTDTTNTEWRDRRMSAGAVKAWIATCADRFRAHRPRDTSDPRRAP